MPQDPCERTWYSWVATPTPRRSSRPSGSVRRCGVTTTVAVVEDGSNGSASTWATSRCQPSGRFQGSSNAASPTMTPSTSRGATRCSTWRTSHSRPSSRSMVSLTPVPSGTCTKTQGVQPSRVTTVAGSVRRHKRSPTSCSDVSTSSGVCAGTPSAARTASMVAAEIGACCPCQSQ